MKFLGGGKPRIASRSCAVLLAALGLAAGCGQKRPPTIVVITPTGGLEYWEQFDHEIKSNAASKVQAEFYGHEKQYKQAVAEYLEAIKIAPNNFDLYEELGDIYRQSDSLKLARDAYGKELQLSAKNPIAMYNLGQIDIETGESEKGLQLLRAVVTNYEGVPAAYFYLGIGEFETGKTAEAALALEKSLSMQPDPNLKPRIEYQLARVYRQLGRNADADQAIHKYTRLKEQNAKQNSAARQNTSPESLPAGNAAPEQQTQN